MKVEQLRFRPDLIPAIRSEDKVETRRPIKATNSIVTPGQFSGLDLETGRARVLLPVVTELRARCRLTTTSRVVTVAPRMMPGGLFWVAPPTRRESRLTLYVTQVHARRVQDMTDADARAEGIAHVRGLAGSPRARYAMLWDQLYGDGAWQANGWVWVYRWNLWRKNVDKVIAQL
jgi:hypothetical protein